MKNRDLPFSFELKLPIDMATETFAFLGRKGRGKTYGAQRYFELLHSAGVQCVALDPVGNWWSLRVGKDGKSDGLKVYVFGGPRGDVPILPDAGAFVARVIVEKGISVILDVSRFRKNERKRFMTAFAEEFFHLKKDAVSPVHLFIEEAHKFVPQMVRDGEEQMLGAMEDIIRIGRNYGIGVSLISQRSASVNKEALTQVECLIAYQTASAQDKKAIKNWIEENDEDGLSLFGEIKSLQRGEALFWSPSVLQVFKKIHVTEKTTFDASSTPKVGDKARRPVKLAKVDLEGIHAAMQEVVATAEANDVKALQRRVKQLEAEVAKKHVPPTKTETVKELLPIITPKLLARVEKLAERLTRDTEKLDVMRDKLAQAQQVVVSEVGNLVTLARRTIDGAAPPPNGLKSVAKSINTLPPRLHADARAIAMQHRPRIGEPAIGAQKHPPMRKAQPAAPAPEGINEPRQRILDTLALLEQLEIEPEKATVAAWYGCHINNKGFTNNVGALRSMGLMNGFALTDEGRALAKPIAIPSQEELRERLLEPLNKPQRAIVEALLPHTHGLSKDDLAAALGLHPNNKGFTNNVGALRTRKVLTDKWPIKAGDVFYVRS